MGSRMVKPHRSLGGHTPVCVRWLDATGHAGDVSRDELAATLKDLGRTVRESYGVLLLQTKEGVWIAGTDDDGGNYSDLTFVPAGMVLKVRRLR
jgi:hypothetical protein